MGKPTLVYDGDCGFCKRWVARWKHVTGDAVEYAPSQEAAKRFPQVPPGAFDRAAQFVDADGAVTEGAAAVFKALEHASWPGPLGLAAYRSLPGFAAASEAVYGLVARHRAAASALTRWLWGEDPTPPTYHLGRWVFLKGLALCYLCAFASFWPQAEGLVGPGGLVPTLSHAAITFYSAGGLLAAAALLAGFAPAASAAAAWVLYGFVFRGGSVFLGFQWDVLLLEAGFLGALAAPWGLGPGLASERAPDPVPLWLVRWLWFRLMFLAGCVKLASGDFAWWDLSALTFHFETQPLPHALSWYAHWLPGGLLRAACGAMFVIELVLPFAVFLPRRPRLAAFLGVNALMLLITLTGNYTFFNLLAMALSTVLLDDSQWGRLLKPLHARLGDLRGRPTEPLGRRALAGAFALFVLPTSLAAGLARVSPEAGAYALVRGAAAAGSTFELVNAYGLFAVMTRPRREIVIEGSYDGQNWLPFEFRWKPGDPARRPGWVQPHQPRLDWQMWFAALSPFQQNPWFIALLDRLLEGSPPVRALFDDPPFAERPPTFLRSVFLEYRFAPPGAPGGVWWERKVLGLYAPVVMLGPDGKLVAVELARR